MLFLIKLLLPRERLWARALRAREGKVARNEKEDGIDLAEASPIDRLRNLDEQRQRHLAARLGRLIGRQNLDAADKLRPPLDAQPWVRLPLHTVPGAEGPKIVGDATEGKSCVVHHVAARLEGTLDAAGCIPRSERPWDVWTETVPW